MVEQVVAHLVEQRLGVEVEAGLGAVPGRVAVSGVLTSTEPLHGLDLISATLLISCATRVPD